MQEQVPTFDWKTFAVVVSAITAILALIISPITAYFITKRQISATVLSNERKEWLLELRTNVASFTSSVRSFFINYYDKTTTEEILNYLQITTELQDRIKLLLDDNDPEQKKLEVTINTLAMNLSFFVKNQSEEVKQAVLSGINSVHEVTRKILKNERTSIKRIK